jgi:hypothetical protein
VEFGSLGCIRDPASTHGTPLDLLAMAIDSVSASDEKKIRLRSLGRMYERAECARVGIP